MTHILFGGSRMSRWFGFDKGPVALPGGHATPCQGQVFRSDNRLTSFAPSFRMVTELDKDVLFTNLPGGPSDRRFSRWYASDLARWIAGEYKEVSAAT